MSYLLCKGILASSAEARPPPSGAALQMPRQHKNVQIKAKQQRDGVDYSTYNEFQTEFAPVGS
jgi:hypothetical protein